MSQPETHAMLLRSSNLTDSAASPVIAATVQDQEVAPINSVESDMSVVCALLDETHIHSTQNLRKRRSLSQ